MGFHNSLPELFAALIEGFLVFSYGLDFQDPTEVSSYEQFCFDVRSKQARRRRRTPTRFLILTCRPVFRPSFSWGFVFRVLAFSDVGFGILVGLLGVGFRLQVLRPRGAGVSRPRV